MLTEARYATELAIANQYAVEAKNARSAASAACIAVAPANSLIPGALAKPMLSAPLLDRLTQRFRFKAPPV